MSYFPSVKMRTVSWLFLILSFSLGIGCAFLVRHYTFEAKPVQIVKQGPTTKILIAKKEIPRGVEITAEAVMFIEVPVAELPSEAATSFAQVDRRQAAFPIPAGYPICNDLLLPYMEDKSKTEKFIPPGSQAISLEINQVSLNDEMIEQPISITNYFAADQHVDIRILPKVKGQGELAERKKQLLKTFLSKNEILEKGEILLENVEIHQIQTKPALDGEQIQTLTLVLEKEDAEKLVTATRKSRIRVVPHHSEPLVESVADLKVPETFIAPISEPITSETNLISQESATLPSVPAPAEFTPVFDPIVVESAASDTGVIHSPIVSKDQYDEQAKTESVQTHAKLKFVPVTLPITDSNEIRNDNLSMIVPPPNFLQEKVDTFEPLRTGLQTSVNRSRSVFNVIEIGLPTASGKSNAIGSSVGYSPWGHHSTMIDSEPKAEKTDDSDLVQPQLLRSRKKVSQL